MLTAWLDHVRKTYSSAIGRYRRDLVTPAIIMDLDVARRNIQFMMKRLSTMKAKLRPHVKCQKSPELAQLQVQAGAIGVCSRQIRNRAVPTCASGHVASRMSGG